MKVAIVGAGISGLACAQRLRDLDADVDVKLFDKSRGLGGRMATRRGDGVAFDHGAQYFTASDPRFVERVAEWEQGGVVAEWTGRIVVLRGEDHEPAGHKRRLVAVPGMSSLARHLAESFEVENSFHLARIDSGSNLTLHAEDGRSTGACDIVVLALPAPQIVTLVEPLSAEVAQRARDASFAPCWAVMVTFEKRVPVDFDGAFVEDSVLSWIARNNSKPGRPEHECWILHATPEWSRAHFDDPPDEVIEASLAAWRDATGAAGLPTITSATAHRWAYSLPQESAAEACVFDRDARVGACGDWCAEARVEGAFLSGLALADRVLGS